MSRLGKLSFGFSFLSFAALIVARMILGGWENALWVPMSLFVIFFGVGIWVDREFYKELMFMKTTKHGMNMGVLILLALVTIIAVNVLATHYNKKWDFTEEKLNSLSDQTAQILRSLQDDMEFAAFFRTRNRQDSNEEMRFKEAIRLFEMESTKVKVAYYNPDKRPDLAEKYKIERTETEGVVILTYKGKQSRITEFGEEAITNAMIKITRDRNRVVFFLQGHGERDTESNEPEGASQFKKALEDASYDVRTLNLVEKAGVPEEASAIVILGPTQPLLEAEIKAIKDYIKKGGKLFIAGDPGKKHNLSVLARTVGIDFANNYVIDQFGQMVGASAAFAIGMKYSPTSEITKDFKGRMTAFQLASELKKSNQAPIGYKFDEVVKSSEASFTRDQISSQIKIDKNKDKIEPRTIVMSVQGKLSEGAPDAGEKEFSVVFFGDSDFASNALMQTQLNPDLAMNSVAFLAQDKDLISVRPKQPKGTMLMMSRPQAIVLMVAFGAVPLMLMATGTTLYMRRRNA